MARSKSRTKRPKVKREGNRIVNLKRENMSVRDMKAQPEEEFKPSFTFEPRNRR